MISGWLYDPEHPAVCTIRARVDGNTIGESRLLFVRQDVCDSLGIAPDFPTGFRLLAQIQDEITGPRNIIIAITAQWHPEGVEDEISSVMVKMLPSLLDTNPYGDVLAPTQAIVLHRPNIYGSGPPVEDANPDMVKLILQYLPPGAIVADIGCGAGAYGPPLLEAGHGLARNGS